MRTDHLRSAGVARQPLRPEAKFDDLLQRQRRLLAHRRPFLKTQSGPVLGVLRPKLTALCLMMHLGRSSRSDRVQTGQTAQLASGSGNKPTAHLKCFLRQLLGDLTGAFDEALDNRTQGSIFQSYQRDQPWPNRQFDGQFLH
jgi:hypothetical protein